MGGPVSAVLLPDRLIEGQIARLESYLHPCSQEAVAIDPLHWEFWVANTQRLAEPMVVKAGLSLLGFRTRSWNQRRKRC